MNFGKKTCTLRVLFAWPPFCQERKHIFSQKNAVILHKKIATLELETLKHTSEESSLALHNFKAIKHAPCTSSEHPHLDLWVKEEIPTLYWVWQCAGGSSRFWYFVCFQHSRPGFTPQKSSFHTLSKHMPAHIMSHISNLRQSSCRPIVCHLLTHCNCFFCSEEYGTLLLAC